MVITKTEILQADDKTLPRLAGEVLRPRSSQHCFVKSYETATGRWKRCRNCNHILHADAPQGSCETDPIPLTWPEAMKWRDWAVEKFGKHAFYEAVEKVFNARGIALTGLNVLYETKAQDYIKAACLCVLPVESV